MHALMAQNLPNTLFALTLRILNSGSRDMAFGKNALAGGRQLGKTGTVEA